MLEVTDRILCVRLRLFPAEFLSRSSTIHKIKSNPLADDQSTFPNSKAHKVIAFQRQRDRPLFELSEETTETGCYWLRNQTCSIDHVPTATHFRVLVSH